MKDIRFLAVDGDYMLLEDAGGTKYRLLVDDNLKRSIRGITPQRLDDSSISPREIQEEIRAGRTIQQIVESSGAPEDYVRKFAQPVLDELDHAVLNALTVRLEVAGDRFSEPTSREFGEIIKSRLAARGAGLEKWSAMKAPDHGFFLYCDFELNKEQLRAIWSYDPKRLSLTPENSLAINLSSEDQVSSEPPRLIPVSSQVSPFTENLADTIDIATSLNNFHQSDTKAPPAAEDKEAPLSETADLLEALRKKRLEREQADSEIIPNGPELRVVEIELDQDVVEAEDTLTHHTEKTAIEEQPVEDTPPPKKGRASIPSWDEIVFGTKTED
jgi:hypothetical protein